MKLVFAGYFGKTHGLKGHLIFKTDNVLGIEKIKALFVEVAGNKVPYFINDVKESNNGFIVGLEEIDSVEKARQMVGKTVFADERFVEQEDPESGWLGFELIDKHYGSLGKIEDVSDNGQQLLVTVKYKGKEIILPLVDDFIEKVDEKKKTIFFVAPEGLIQLFIDEK